MMEKAVILSTGDELTTGRVVDTNSVFIADKLHQLGVEVAAVLKVGDKKEMLLWALKEASNLGDLIIGTGGLGPTVDDLTTEAVAEFLGRELKQDRGVIQALKRRFEARGLPFTPNNLKQALFPEGAQILPNPSGTAPGFQLSFGDGKTLIWLSGVPQEMEAMLGESVLPWISRQNEKLARAFACTFKIYGLTESKLDDILKPVFAAAQAQLSFRAHYPDLSLRLTVRGGREAEKKFLELRDRIQELIGPYIYGVGEETLEEIVGRLLFKKGWTVALAESCTGGYLSHRITRVAGSSAYFKGGAVTYSDGSKIRFSQVRPGTLEKYGAVSREVALEMAQGIRKEAEADIGLSVTGVAGPTGGSPETPVGTVWIGLAGPEGVDARVFRFHGDRERIIAGTSQAALNWLRLFLIGEA